MQGIWSHFAHTISEHYRDFEHAYVYWIWLRGSASYVINASSNWPCVKWYYDQKIISSFYSDFESVVA